MTDDKRVVEQIHEYENLVANVLSKGMKICEILQENVLLEKFPPSWNDYRNHLKHKKKDLKLQELISHMRTEEANKLKDKKGRPSQKPTPQANLAEQDSEIIAAIVKANLIENKTDWILDTRASRHFCTNRELLHDYEDTADGESCSWKTQSLQENLVSGSLLNRVGLKIVLEGDKVVLTKNGDFVEFRESNGIIHEFTAPYSSQQNGIAERKNRTLKEMMNVMLLSSGLSDNMWGEAVLSACFVLNRIPHKRLDKTPYELWKGHAPNLSYLKVWGCLAKVPFPALKKSTVGSKTFDCIFIGLSNRMHDPENPSIVSETSVSETVDTSNLRCKLELRRSKRQRIEKSFGPDFLSTFIVEKCDEIDCNFTNLYLIDEDPKTYQEALNSVDSSMWKETIKSELDSLVMNHTWDLVDLPMGNKPIGYLEEADVILGVKIRKNKTSLSLCQSHYVEKILKKFDSVDVSPVRTPFDASKHLKQNKGDSVSQPEYAKIIDSVMYLMNYTRPNIAYAVSRLSRYTHNPDRYHWDALRHLLRYLKGTIDYCLHFNKFPAVLEGYCDANWVTDNDEVNSISGYIFLLEGGAIFWKSAKQTCIARSTMESEFIALELAGQEVEWIKNLLGDVPLWGTSVPVSIQCDSQAAICTAKNSVYNGKSRHIRLRHAVVKQLLKEGTISLEFVRSEKNLADPLTKGLTRKMVLDSSMNMDLKPFGDP
ncbi:ty1-copia retrotransposon protein [Cucumis melo var. makuwa]|uniref:Ty1-copia retrotransposon protein n=1 Tax=Cucumis melo var. makuwa TaxID=1194695 RepID=A0A5D3CAN6_CUCMM|nr:ty1-copia retrotransposon protein [Cucumis melo var. makuwa]